MPETPNKRTAKDLFCNYEVTEATFTIVLPKGDVVVARCVRSGSEVIAIEKKARTLQRICKDRARAHEAVRPFLPQSDEVVRFCVYCEALLVDPKLTFKDAMEMAATCGALIPMIGVELTSKTGQFAAAAEMDEVEEEKKDSNGMDTGESSS